MKSNNKNDTVNRVIVERPERVSLSKGRDMLYEKFRTNLRVLRGKTDVSAVDLSKQIGLESGARISNLEYGKGNPTVEELVLITKYFCISIDDILHKEAVITFK